MSNISPAHAAFDAVLLIGFGGPQGRDDIRPFLRNVLRGRRVSEERLEAVVKHYELFDGVSPLTAITQRQVAGLRERLQAEGPALPVYVGMRNWRPFLEDTLEEMGAVGITRALGLTLAAHHSYSSCWQYKQNVARARTTLRAASRPDVEVTYVGGWHDHAGFVGANAYRIDRALNELPAAVQDRARLIFTAHSIPVTMASESRYEAELRETAALVARTLGRTDWALAFQSRSGRPQDPWLEPDICDYLRTERTRGLEATVISPIGFVADHIEVLYDLDWEAAQVCEAVRLPMARAATVNDHPLFLDMLADVVRRTCRLYRYGHPLSVVSPESPPHFEPSPPTR